MKVIGLMPVRNEAWVLRHSLSCLSGFCDVVFVHDQSSQDASRDICRDFPKVHLISSDEADICERARFRLLDAAREYDGNNLIWFNDADELVSPSSMRRFLAASSPHEPGTVVECLFYTLWKTPRRYRNDFTLYRPHLKAMAFVDDRSTDYDRSTDFPLHVPRVPIEHPARIVTATEVRVLHLQWTVWERNQMKQAWYRCSELLNHNKPASEINALYSIAFDAIGIKTTAVPSAWVEDVTFPDVSVNHDPSWHEREILSWFNVYGVERFEPLEIWHLRVLREEFQRCTGRRPRPDRSYQPRWTVRLRRSARAAARALKLRLTFEP
jgi:Glycosyl transferase family 2